MLMRMGSTHELQNKHIAKAAPGGRAPAKKDPPLETEVVFCYTFLVRGIGAVG